MELLMVLYLGQVQGHRTMDKTLLEEACSEWAATRGTVGIIQQVIINNQILKNIKIKGK